MPWTGRCGYYGRLSFTRGAVSAAALEQLARLEKLRASSSPGHLQFSPKWDDLRGDARFEKIVASVAAPLKIE